MDSFLQSQIQGGVFESSREFSVNLVAAQQKLGKYSLPRQTAWILKLVQCATELTCPELRVFIGKDRFEVRFPAQALAPIESLKERCEKLAPGGAGEDHLFGGLLALSALPGEVTYQAEGALWRPGRAGPLEKDQSDRSDPRVVFRADNGGFWDRLIRRLRETVSLQEELTDNCYPAPVCLYLDSRLLTNGLDQVPLLSGLIAGEAGADLDYYGQIRTETGNRDLTFCQWGSSRPAHIGYVVQIRATTTRERSTLSVEWLRSGVVVSRETVNLPRGRGLRGRLLVPTRGLKFDASGFAVQQDAVARDRAYRSSLYLKTAIEALQGELARPRKWDKFVERCHPGRNLPASDQLIAQLEEFLAVTPDLF